MYINGVKQDLRIVKTKKALIGAFSEMMREEPFEKLTVNDLCDRAGIRRATFYKHFKDKNDFLIFLISEDKEHFIKRKWNGKAGFGKDYLIAYVSNLVENLANNRNLVENIISSSVKHILIELLISQNFESTLENFKKAENDGASLPASSENLTAILIGGIAVVIYNWCLSGMTQPKEDLIEEISTVIGRLMC